VIAVCPVINMKTVQINTYDIRGGAARAANRLQKGLRLIGVDSWMLVKQKESSDQFVISISPEMDFFDKLRGLVRMIRINCNLQWQLRKVSVPFDLFSDDRSIYGETLIQQVPQCELVNLHWVAQLVDFRDFIAEIAKHVPIAWTLHDMNAFTGGCHYDGGCGRYMNGCGSCPQLGSSGENDLSRRIWLRKRQVYEKLDPSRFHIVTPSRWLANQANNSSLLGRFPVSIIPNGLNLVEFAPRDRSFCRDVLGISPEAKVLLFVADSINIKRKGFDLLTGVLKSLKGVDNLLLIAMGNSRETIDIPVPHLHLGHIKNDRLLSIIYSSADVYIISSLQDNLPNTVMESMACGTPVAGFDVGGISDMVRPGVTGLLAQSQKVEDLCAAIVELLEDHARREEMGANCRRIAEEEYALENQAQRYVELYEKILGQK
jgi:glycosyltransferase involved in cell wall biosynthesis